MTKRDRVTIVGAGGWGTALAVLLARKGLNVLLWARRREIAAELEQTRENSRLLPGVHLPNQVVVTADLASICSKPSEAIVMAVPSQGLRAVASQLGDWRQSAPVIVSVIKGLETGTKLRPSQVLQETLTCTEDELCILSGPSHAEEVSQEVPTAVVVASTKPQIAERVQKLFFTPRFRVYTHSDPAGVELGGALKNIIAIACGIGEGLGFGDNTQAALITRGLTEMTRLGCALGARRDTFRGLAGLGDLVVTCTSQHSRNRSLGLRIGRGEGLPVILEGIAHVVEGVHAAQTAWQIAQEKGIDMPITEQVHAVLFQHKPPAQGLQELLSREARSEEESSP